MPGEVATDRLERALRAGLARVPGVAAAFLFGSQASGRARADSDIDLAVLFDHDPAAPDRLATARSVIETLGEHVSASLIDVVILNDAPNALAFQVLKHGRLLACHDETALHRFRVRTWREHGDRESVERLLREATRARVAKLGRHG